MNPEAVLAVLPDNKDEAISMKEIALELGLDISSYTAMAKTRFWHSINPQSALDALEAHLQGRRA